MQSDREKNMSNIIEYGGYRARIEWDTEDKIFTGTVLGIKDSLSFHGASAKELKDRFKECIENYFFLCGQIGKEPEKYLKKAR